MMHDESSSEPQRYESFAREALELSKNSLLVNVRFMSHAFSLLRPAFIPGPLMATDGSQVRIDPRAFARMYAEEPARAARAFLHVVLHNVFLHLYPGGELDPLRWDAACDIAVERTITELDLPATRTLASASQQALFAQIEPFVPTMTAEALYRHLVDSGMPDEDVAALRAAFEVDDHAVWHRVVVDERDEEASRRGAAYEDSAQSGASAQTAGESGTDMDLPDEEQPSKPKHASHRGMDPEDITQKEKPENVRQALGERLADTINLDRSREQWKNAAYEMGVQLDSYIKLWGLSGAHLAMNLRAVTREKHDYREFLRKFARMGEQIRVNDDEFDYIFYCYGLSRFGNLPLIEPLEFVEEKRIRDFVIAIDTSASTKDGLVRKFIEKTYSILSNETSFFADMNVLIIQCDAAIADVTRIGSLADLESYVDDLQIKGIGGTDFRPVFEYVNGALERGELTNLGGLLYFTDAQGTFPAKKPEYDTAFVLVDDPNDAEVPPWAMKIVLEETVLLE